MGGLVNEAREPIRPVVLAICDGFGFAPSGPGNAITRARTPHLTEWQQTYPVVTLQAAGESVGLKYGEMGNSEVGHTTIGAGRIIFQSLPRIDRAIQDRSFFSNEAFLRAMDHVLTTNGTLHLLGIFSEGNIHGSQEHLFALLELARQKGIPHIAFHLMVDGRDTAPRAALKSLTELRRRIGDRSDAIIATIGGRYFGMDRDERWDRVQRMYDAMVYGKGPTASTPEIAIQAAYDMGINDEMIPPTVLVTAEGTPCATVRDGDAVIYSNFRPDRARQLTEAFVLPGFEKFDRGAWIKNLVFSTMMTYDDALPVEVAFPPQSIVDPLGKILSDAMIPQLHIAETEKYAHITVFFNGGAMQPFPGQENILIQSPQVATYDLKPEMSANLICEEVIKQIDTGRYGFIVVNFANADMVGHTGNLPATIKAIETLDDVLGQVAEATMSVGGVLLITGDHGNAEMKIDPLTGVGQAEHTANPVPLYLLWEKAARPAREPKMIPPVGLLSDIAPTVLDLIGLPPNPSMTGRSLLPILL